ncbi:MAG: hypothetical protein MJE77_10795 [Proteobacteria bacterium]|nr:hypothetical protein [Pseudomonadota bacterium]
MKQDQFMAVAVRQRGHQLRDAVVSLVGAGIIAFQMAAFTIAFTAPLDEAVVAAKDKPAIEARVPGAGIRPLSDSDTTPHS